MLMAIAVDPNAPISLAGFLAIIGLVISWILFGVAMWNFRQQLRKRDEDETVRSERSAKRVCEEYVKGEEYGKLRDQRAAEMARVVFAEIMRERTPQMYDRVEELCSLNIDKAFRDRAPSFVDSKVFERAERAILDQIKTLQQRVDENTRKLGETSGQITRDVVTAVAQMLQQQKRDE